MNTQLYKVDIAYNAYRQFMDELSKLSNGEAFTGIRDARVDRDNRPGFDKNRTIVGILIRFNMPDADVSYLTLKYNLHIDVFTKQASSIKDV
jgi:hypothetical protein